ncbi:MAG: hypothetical protein Q8R39_03035 [bacterium]|nr:hypothetical protein [bacterium]MDZ4285125.1 hypothetical protein [Patescibacteria group bacterium]
MPDTVTLPKTEYEYLHRIAERYELLQNAVREDFFEEPSVRDTGEIIATFKKSERYNKAFLQSLSRGLRESSFLKKSNKQ